MSYSFPPAVFDRADGSGGIGTPAVNNLGAGGQFGINSAGGNGEITRFEEYSDSPTIEQGEQSTIVHRFHGDYYTIQTIFISTPRGTTFTDSHGYLCRVLTVNMAPIGKINAYEWNLTITAECISFGQPPDEFGVENVELNPAAEKHPRYNALTYNDKWLIRGANVTDDPDTAQSYVNQINAIPSTTNPFTNRQGQALELLYKKQKGEDSFYMSGYKVTWSTYFWYPQFINPGGYIEDPILAGGLPAPFWSNTGLVTGTSIFNNITIYNSNLFPYSIIGGVSALSWFRQTDTLTLQRTWFRLTRTWVGAPLGVWDNEWYNRISQPLQTSASLGSVNAYA